MSGQPSGSATTIPDSSTASVATTPKQVLLQAIANNAGNYEVVTALSAVAQTVGDGNDPQSWKTVADALIKLIPSRTIPIYSRYFPRRFHLAFPQYVQLRSSAWASPAWYTPSTASLSLAISDKEWSSVLIDVLGSDAVYYDGRIQRAISKAFKEGQMLETAQDLGIPVYGRSKRAIMSDIVRYFKPVSGYKKTRRSGSRRRSRSR